MGVSPFTVHVCPYLPASTILCFLFCVCSLFLSLRTVCVLVPFFVCGLCFSVWVCWVCVLLFLCSGVLVSSLGVYVSWYLCVLCVGGLVFVSGLCVLFPVVCGVLLTGVVLCVYVCVGWCCVYLWCVSLCCLVGCWGCSLGVVFWFWAACCMVCFSVCVGVSLIWCAWFLVFTCVLLVYLVCFVWVCGGSRGLGVCCFCFWVLAWFCFLVGCWCFVFCWAGACWFSWWFIFVGCLGGFCVLGAMGCVLFFWSYIICVDCGGALRVSACVGFLFGVTACFWFLFLV